MTGGNTRQLRVLHIVSANGAPAALHASLFMPLLIRLPKQRVKAQIVSLAAGAVPAAVLRQQGVPVHDVPFSRSGFSLGARQALVKIAQQFRPDVLHAWGQTALWLAAGIAKSCDWEPRVIASLVETAPLPRNAGLIDRQKLQRARKAAARIDRIVCASEAGAAQYRRIEFPSDRLVAIQPGVDAARFKPDLALRRKVREQLQLPPDAFVVGMLAPFQPEYDHATFVKGVGELIKTQPNLHLLLAGHGVQRGNAALMALVGGGTLATRTHLLGDWSDTCSFYNACEVACSSALGDGNRMSLVMAMLCGVPCVGTGMGAQGEVIGHYGVAIEPGSPQAVVRGISRILQLTPEKRAQLAQGARKHALQNFVYVRTLQKYLELYQDVVGRETTAAQDVPAPEIDVTVPVRTKEELTATAKPRAPAIEQIVDPDSIEAQVAAKTEEKLPKWRIEQEQQRAKRDAELLAPAPATAEGDVLELFEQQLSRPTAKVSPMNERARGVADESEELLPLEALAVPVPKSGPTTRPSAAASLQTDVSEAKSAAATAAPFEVGGVAPAPATPVPAASTVARVDTLIVASSVPGEPEPKAGDAPMTAVAANVAQEETPETPAEHKACVESAPAPHDVAPVGVATSASAAQHRTDPKPQIGDQSSMTRNITDAGSEADPFAETIPSLIVMLEQEAAQQQTKASPADSIARTSDEAASGTVAHASVARIADTSAAPAEKNPSSITGEQLTLSILDAPSQPEPLQQSLFDLELVPESSAEQKRRVASS